MKYSNTSRVLNLVFHGLIVLAFGALGLYFGLMVAPFGLASSHPSYTELGAPYLLYFELGVIGLTLCSISVYGFIQALKGIKENRNDEPVVKAFTAFIVEGYIAALFCLLNAVVFFDLISGNSVAFVIIVGIVLAIALMIATNIPMVKLYDGKDQTPLLAGFAFGAAILFGWITIVDFGTLVGSWAHGVYSYYKFFNGEFLGYTLGFLAITLMLAFAGVLLLKRAQDPKAQKLAGHLGAGSILLVAFAFIVNGLLELIYNDTRLIHLNGENFAWQGNGFGIASLVIGGLVLIASIFVEVSNATGKPMFRRKK